MGFIRTVVLSVSLYREQKGLNKILTLGIKKPFSFKRSTCLGYRNNRLVLRRLSNNILKCEAHFFELGHAMMVAMMVAMTVTRMPPVKTPLATLHAIVQTDTSEMDATVKVAIS